MDTKSLKSKMSNVNGSKSNSPMPVPNLATNRPATESHGEDEEESQFMIYYYLGSTCLRPVGFVKGVINQVHSNTVPYMLRRSSGEIQVVPYEPSNALMVHDYDYVLESNIAPRNTCSVTIMVHDEAKVNVYGEMFGGYCFEAPSMIELNGKLNMAYWTNEGLAEEPTNCNVKIEVTEGVANIFVCDNKELVLMYDSQGKYNIGLVQEEGEKVSHDGGESSGKSGNAAKTIERICSTSKQDQSSAADQLSGTPDTGAKEPTKSASNNSSIESSDNEQNKPKTVPSKLKNKFKRNVAYGSSDSTMIKIKSKQSKSDIKQVKSLTGSTDKEAPTRGTSLLQGVINSMMRWASLSKPRVSSSKENSKGSSDSKGNSDKSNLNRKNDQFKKRPKDEHNVKLAKSKFNVPTPSSSHNLSSKLSRTKTASDTTRNSNNKRSPDKKATTRSPNRAQPIKLQSKSLVSSSTKQRFSSSTSIKSNPSSGSMQTDTTSSRTKSQEAYKMKVKIALAQLLTDVQKPKDTRDQDVEDFKEKTVKLIETLKELVERTSGSEKQMLGQELNKLRHYMVKLNTEQYEMCANQIAIIVKKIDGQLAAN